MRRLILTASMVVAVSFVQYAGDVAAVADAMSRPGRYAFAVESSPSGMKGRVLVEPSGAFLIERMLPGGDTSFMAFFADSIYSYSRGELSREAADGRESGAAAAWVPAVIAGEIRKALADTARYTVTRPSAEEVAVSFHPGGVEYTRTELRLDPASGRPVSKTVTRTDDGSEMLREDYSPLDGELPERIDASYLRRRFPDAFVARLPHTRLKRVNGEGRVDLREEARDALVVVLDAVSAEAGEMMTRARGVASGRPVFWAFTNTRVEDIAALCPSLPAGETALSNASGLGYESGSMIIIENSEIKEIRCLR